MPQAESRPRPLPELQATVLELRASPDLQRPPGTQLHTFWKQLETTQNHKKRADLTGKCLKQKVVPGLFQSSQATVLELWASLDLERPPWTELDTFWNQLETTQNHKKRTDLTGKCLKQKVVPGLLVRSSKNLILELFASSDPAGTPLDPARPFLELLEA